MQGMTRRQAAKGRKPATKQPTEEQRKWHHTPLEERQRILQSGQGIPSFIRPGSVKSRLGYLGRAIGRQSMQKAPVVKPTGPVRKAPMTAPGRPRTRK